MRLLAVFLVVVVWSFIIFEAGITSSNWMSILADRPSLIGMGMVPLILLIFVFVQKSRTVRIQKTLVEKRKWDEVINALGGYVALKALIQELNQYDHGRVLAGLEQKMAITEATVTKIEVQDNDESFANRIAAIVGKQQMIHGRLRTLRRSLEEVQKSLSRLEEIKDSIENALLGIKDESGSDLTVRIAELEEFERGTSSRVILILEEAQALDGLKQRLNELKVRLAPITDKGTGVVAVLAKINNFCVDTDAALADIETDNNGDDLLTRIENLRREDWDENGIENLSERLDGILEYKKEIEKLCREYEAFKIRYESFVGGDMGITAILSEINDFCIVADSNLAKIETNDNGEDLDDQISSLRQNDNNDGLEDLDGRLTEVATHKKAIEKLYGEFEALKTHYLSVMDTDGSIGTLLKNMSEFFERADEALRDIETDGNGDDLETQVDGLKEKKREILGRLRDAEKEVENLIELGAEITTLSERLVNLKTQHDTGKSQEA